MLIGRDHEVAAIASLLASARESRGGALVVRGEAGVGKTALLRDAEARAEGMRVLRAVGVDSEAELPFAGLHQVLTAGLDRLDRLPAPQAAALRGAFGLSAERVDDRFLISLGALGLLADIAEERPVLVVVDDAQWLDRPSAEALGFVARRIGAEPIAMLLAAREGDPRRLDAPGVDELHLVGLDRPSARALLDAAAGPALAPHVAEHLVSLTRGNPLALVELPAVIDPEQLAGRAPLPDHLPLTSQLERVFLDRARALPGGARAVLSVAAADESGDLGTVLAAAARLGAGRADLAPAEEAGLLVVSGDRIELRHPLARSALRAGAFADRQAAHEALAAVLTDEADADRRAWHLAATAVAPDDEVAGELERTADRARARSGHAAAAAALERSARLSSGGADRARRLVTAAECAWLAGRTSLAMALADEAEPLAGTGRMRAEVLHVRGSVELLRGRPGDGYEILLAGADAAAREDPDLALHLLLSAAEAAMAAGMYDGVVTAARRADDLAGALTSWGRVWLAGVGRVLGHDFAGAMPFLREAMAAADGTDDPRSLVWAANAAVWLGDPDAAMAVQSRAVSSARARGAFAHLAVALLRRGALLAWHGQVREAMADGEEGLRLTEEAGLDNSAAQSRAVIAIAAALRGDAATCTAEADRALALAELRGLAPTRESATYALGSLDLALGRHDAAVDALLEIAGPGPDAGRTPLSLYAAVPDLVEAAARAGRGAEAGPALVRLSHWQALTGAPWMAPVVARSRGLLATGDEAEAHLREALRLHEPLSGAFQRARAELCLGEHLRRTRRRAEARGHLRRAAIALEALGADPWAERARDELRATGEATRRPDPSTAAALTPQELRIARAVAEGASNKEVAAHLFLSPKTVEYHLGKVFQKLGVASRGDLARMEAELAA
jgi:DNA-binding CsgD family transcriptional regulator